MPFMECVIIAADHSADDIENVLFGAGAVSVTLEDAADKPILEPLHGATPLWPMVVIKGLFTTPCDAQRTEQAIRRGLIDQPDIQWRDVADKTWEREWLKDFKPMSFGNGFWICPGGQFPPQPYQPEKIVWLDPGLAFGTGTHATTALCLEYLAQQPPHGAHFIDIGCGSGILSIAALRLGATRGHAMDIDPQALIATDENAQRNSVRAQLTLGDETTGWDGQYNLILANILAEPLIALADRIAGIASPGATVLLSGLLDTQTDSVLRAYEGHFTMAKPLLKDGWAALYGTFNA